MTSPIETNNVVELIDHYADSGDVSREQLAEQIMNLFAAERQSLSDRINVLEGALQLVRRIAKPLIEVDDVWEDSTHIVTAIDNALTQGGKNV